MNNGIAQNSVNSKNQPHLENTKQLNHGVTMPQPKPNQTKTSHHHNKPTQNSNPNLPGKQRKKNKKTRRNPLYLKVSSILGDKQEDSIMRKELH